MGDGSVGDVDGSGKSWPYPAHTIPSYKLHQEWYNHLLQTQGKEAAESYADQVRERARMYNSLHHRGRHEEMKGAWLYGENHRMQTYGGSGGLGNGYSRYDDVRARGVDAEMCHMYGTDFTGRISPPHPENDFRSPWEHDDKDRVVRFIQESIDRELQGTSIDQLQQNLWDQWSNELHPQHPLYLRRIEEARYCRTQQLILQQQYGQREPDVFDTMAHFDLRPDQRAHMFRRNFLPDQHCGNSLQQRCAFPHQDGSTVLQQSCPSSRMLNGMTSPGSLALCATSQQHPDLLNEEELLDLTDSGTTWSPTSKVDQTVTVTTTTPTFSTDVTTSTPLTYAGALRKPPNVKSPTPQSKVSADDPLNLLKNLNIAPKSPDGSYQYFQ